ncbi:MAG: hypothetical protein ACJZ87_06335 [Paracoccaceae bacterium]
MNEGVKHGNAPFIYRLNGDDWLLPDGLYKLVEILQDNPTLPAAYGNVWKFFAN